MVSGPVTSVARVEAVQIFLKDPVYIYILYMCICIYIYTNIKGKVVQRQVKET